jgi:hypothetical protein
MIYVRLAVIKPKSALEQKINTNIKTNSLLSVKMDGVVFLFYLIHKNARILYVLLIKF